MVLKLVLHWEKHDMEKEVIDLVYIDDEPEEALSAYLEDEYKNEKCSLNIEQIHFKCDQGYESLLQNDKVISSNVIVIDSKLFENDNVKHHGKFSGEEFKMILRKVYPFIEVVVVSQNGEDENYEIIPKYRSENIESYTEHYEKVLKDKLNESINKIITFRNISKKLGMNNEIDKLLIERTVDSLNGISDYEELKKSDIDELITAFKKMNQE